MMPARYGHEGAIGYASLVQRHLDWSDQQRRILTAHHHGQAATAPGTADDNRGVAETADRNRGLLETDDDDDELLPHHHLARGDSRHVFRQWKKNQETCSSLCPVVGAWTRLLLYGGWEHVSSMHTERTYNVQTHTLFVDLRVPRSRNVLLSNVHALDAMTAQQLRYLARQHVFAGYTMHQPRGPYNGGVAVRHHCLDWNYVGTPRSRPNQWHIEFPIDTHNIWKEWAYGTDEHGQHYYCEHWERLSHQESGGALSSLPSVLRLALRKRDGTDGIVVVVGNHFGYCLQNERPGILTNDAASLVSLVDTAVATNNLDQARAWLSMQGGHGLVSSRHGKWRIDCAIEPWREGMALWPDNVRLEMDSNGGDDDAASAVARPDNWYDEATVFWNNQAWDVFECSLATPRELQALLEGSIANYGGAVNNGPRTLSV